MSRRIGSRLNALAVAIADPARRDMLVPALLAIYAVLWAIYGTIAKGSQDLHFDTGEMYAWSLDVSWGTPKHPPAGAWLVGGWFALFPRTDWAYFLFAMTMASVALYFGWRISIRYLPRDKQPIALALLMLVPFFNFHALKFNANTVMIPLWALATWAFLRSFETRRPGWAALVGAAAALAMLGKYWAVFLLAGLGGAALADSRRTAYFRSTAPWITIATGVAVLAPHLWWLATNDFGLVNYAFTSHHRTAVEVLWSLPYYLAGAIGYVAVPIAAVAIAARGGGADLADIVWPRDPDRRLLLLALLLPLLLPVVVAAVTRSELSSIWIMGALTLLPVVLLSSPSIRIPPAATRAVLAIVIVLPLLAIAAAPIVALQIHRHASATQPANFRLAAQAVDRLWRETTARPLRLVGGEIQLANAITFYSAGDPSSFDVHDPGMTPWIDPARIARDGIAWVCPLWMPSCVDAITSRAAALPPGRRAEVSTERVYLGIHGPAQRYLIIITPPSAAPR
jgi:hypothetical protein